MSPTIERQTMRKVYLRLLPLAMIVYFFCYLDRINVSFAALQMNADIGLTAAAYGLSSTAFYIGYCLFEVPSNVILDKVGARIWIARIMISWGLVSGATAFATGPISFLTIRLLLGFAEAGLFPGIVLLFTYWFPDHHRARIVSSFTLALPISVALGAPVSTAILGLDGWMGYAGWKWIFLLEAMPTVVIGIVVLFALTDRPAKAAWLSAEEKNWLITTLDHERRLVESARKFSMWEALVNPKIVLLSINYLGIVTASLGLLLFVPQIIKSLGTMSNMTVGWLTMIPYICGGISLVVWGRISDKMNERRWNLLVACVLSTGGLVLAGYTMGTWWAMVGMSLAAIGFYGSKGPFFAMPPIFLSGTALAAGFAWINSIGNLGGTVGPYYVGYMKDLTGSFAGGLYGLALLALVAALVCAFYLDIPDRAPEAEANMAGARA
jgi:MFS transporter, ACS family, tartrate transporter